VIEIGMIELKQVSKNNKKGIRLKKDFRIKKLGFYFLLLSVIRDLDSLLNAK